MASKTIDHLELKVGIAPYEYEGCSFDALHVSVGYQKGAGFYVSWTPVKLHQHGYQTGMLPSKDPLMGGAYFLVDRVPKNNSKRLTEMHAALELAKEGIRLYFDLRLWTQMNDFIRYVCLYGFTEHYRQQVETLKAKNNINNKSSEDNTMRLNMDANKSENQNVAMEPQVNNNTAPAIEDAVAVEIKDDVDVAEVDDIKPVVTKRAVAEAMVQAANGGPATTMPLGSHGTLVIAGVGGTKADGGSKKADVPQTSDIKPQTSTKVQDSVAAAESTDKGGRLTYATYEKQKTNKTTGKPYTVTHAKIMGFAATDEAYQRGVELHGAVSGEMVDGVKVLGLYFSHRYAAAAKLVCDALNAGKTFAECVAIIDNATEENAKKRQEWKAKIEERKQKREERKAVKNQPSAVSRQTSEKSYTLDEVAAMLGKLLPDGAAKVDDIKKLLKAA